MDDKTLLTFVVAIVGFLGGSVVASVLGWIRSWLIRPVIRSELTQVEGCYAATHMVANNSPPFDARFPADSYPKRGTISDQRMCGHVTRIQLDRANSSSEIKKEVLELRWAHKSAGPKDIPVGAFFYMDVVQLIMPPQGVALLPCSDFPSSFSASLTQTPVFGPRLPSARYRLTVLIAAENAVPVERLVEFKFDPSKTDLDITFD